MRALDLSLQLVIVPTKQAGRRLREALATGAQALAATGASARTAANAPPHSVQTHAAAQSTALFPPLVLTFDALLEVLREASGHNGDARVSLSGDECISLSGGENAESFPQAQQASQSQVLLVWVDVLLSADLDAFRAVFPVNPPVRDFAWARELAEPLTRLQDELRENDLGLCEVAEQLEPDFPEFARWQELAELERRQRARLADHGLASPLAAQRELFVRGALPSGIERVCVLAWPDPRPMALRLLERVAESLPVEVCVYAPECERDNFDAWGRPIPEKWAQRELRLPEFEERVRVCADPHEQAERLAEAVALYYNNRESAETVAAGARPDRQAQRPSNTSADSSSGPRSRPPSGALALGVLDEEILQPLETALRERGVPSYNPEGRERRGDRLHQLLSALAAFAREDSFHALARLVRQPDVLRALCADNDAEGVSFLAELDRVYEQHLPPDLAAVRARWRSADSAGRAALARLAEWREELRRGEFPQNVQSVLAQIFRGRSFDLAKPDDAAWVAAAEVWAECVREVAEAAPLCLALCGPTTDREVLLELAIARYARDRVFTEKSSDAVELQGWLELVWEDAPHLIIAGLNEGKVPASVRGDLFLPESLREKLGLKTNAQRFAVDAYYLQAAAGCRCHSGDAVRAARAFVGASSIDAAGSQTLFAGGPFVEGPSCSNLSDGQRVLPRRLDVLLGRVSAKGDPLKPSRLLLRCADEELPPRVQFLFSEPPPRGGANVAWSRAWKLQLPDPHKVELPAHFPVTGLRAWLDCPLRFYLSRVLKLRPVDPKKTEMDAMDFGTLCHAALEAMGREAREGSLRSCMDAARLQRALREALDEAVAQKFGRRLSVPLRVQVESARQRLDALAVEQARLHAEGWRIKSVEWEFEVPIGPLVFRGKIDRIDEHEASGALRVIDYKTSDKADSPEKVHLVSPPRLPRSSPPKDADEPFPDWRLWSPEGAKKPRAWGDLQLPIYERVCAGEFSGRDLRCGYFNLPRAVGDTALSLWENYTPELAAAAWGCAEGVASAIARREFWPPRELKPWDAERDEFATLFQRGAAESILFGQSGKEAAAL